MFTAKRTIHQLIANADDAVLSGFGELDAQNYLDPIATDVEVDLRLVKRILDRGLEKLRSDELELTKTLDQWLAPRIHSAVRIPRRLAGDMGFWSWMVTEIGREYTWVRWRENKPQPTMYRYTGDFKRNALARLWWFPEMSRNGPDYSPIRRVLRDPSTAQYAMELRYSMYRPAVIAFGNIAVEEDLGFASLKDLSKRANAYLSLRALEAIGLDSADGARDRDWWNEAPVEGELISDVDVVGPRDNYASSQAIEHIGDWFRSLVHEREKAMVLTERQ
jgi:hypothetical protein